MGACAPGGQNCPKEHSIACVAPGGQKAPSWQGVHTAAPAEGEKVLFTHSWGVWLLRGQAVPAGQSMGRPVPQA